MFLIIIFMRANKWLVFPHELDGLSIEEIEINKPELKDLISNIKNKV